MEKVIGERRHGLFKLIPMVATSICLLIGTLSLVYSSLVGATFSSSLGTSSGTQNVCRALVLAGGGEKGAYEVGVLQGLSEVLIGSDAEWDIVTGVSVGSVNAMTAVPFPKGQENQWVATLRRIWSELGKSNVYKQWPFGEMQGLLFKSGIYDSSPLQDLLWDFVRGYTSAAGHDIYDPSYLPGRSFNVTDRMVSVSATDMENGATNYWTEQSSADVIVQAVMASTAIPGIFPFVKIGDRIYNDATITRGIDVGSAVSRCLDSGRAKNEAEVVVDIVLCNPEILPADEHIGGENSVEVLLRAAALRGYYTSSCQINSLTKDFPSVQFRYIVRPEQSLPGRSLDFDQKDIQFMMMTGRQDAIKAVKKRKGYGEGVQVAR